MWALAHTLSHSLQLFRRTWQALVTLAHTCTQTHTHERTSKEPNKHAWTITILELGIAWHNAQYPVKS